MFKREDGGDDDFVTKTNKSRKKSGRATSTEDAGSAGAAPDTGATAAGASSAPSASASEGISLRPRTMFTVKGRGRTPEADPSPAYRPQWSKDGDGFVSNTPSTKDGDSDSRGGDASRRKGKVLRYSRDELLALHVEAESPPHFLVESAVASEISLPPVGSLPFDYEEIYKQWSLNKNRGRGRGRTTTGNAQATEGANNSSERSRSNGKWEETKWDKSKRGDENQQGDAEGSSGRGTAGSGGTGGGRNGADIWDDVGGSDSMELDLSSMAAAAEKFRREMDAMRDQEQMKIAESADVSDMDAFDQKLEHAAAAGQFEDSDEEVAWDMPLESELPPPVQDTPLLFQSAQFDEKLEPTPDPHALRLDEPAFNLASLSDSSFGLGALSLEPEVLDEWYYLDPQGLQQGPFKTAEMREWFEAGYFKPNLPIRFGRDGTFTPLANNFLQGQLPFASLPRPSPKINLVEDMRRREQQRLLEIQQHQQQQQQMMRLQQQQEQQRMMQFNQEEKIRMEMQRLEMARQQQNHIYQQQQHLLHHQQQQQQILLQQQSSWQRSQREGIMSALGIFGGADNGLGVQRDHYQHDQTLPFGSDFRNSRQVDMGSTRVHEPSFTQQTQHVEDPWGIGQRAVEPPSEPTFFSAQPASQAVRQEAPRAETPKQSSVAEGPWVNLTTSVEGHPEVPSSTVETQSKRGPSPPPASPKNAATKPMSPVEVTKTASVGKKPSSTSATQQTGAWANSSSTKEASTKSLKEIQAEEKRELRQSIGQGDNDLAHMGAQLKMMLGVSAQSGHMQPPTSSPVPPAPSGPVPVATPAPVTTPAPAPVRTEPSPSPWGRSAPVAQPLQTSKSMREILQEEERLAAERAKRAEAAPTSSHWMNVVAGTSSTPAAVSKVSRLGPVPASVLKSTTRQSRASVASDATSSAQKKPVQTPTKVDSDASFWNFGAATKSSETPSASATANFGSGNIPSEFMSWCAKQIKGINGSDDLTLVEYCATLEDPGEVREYLAAYLGSTPRVSAFATEFIQRKKSMPSMAKKSPTVSVSGDGGESNGAKKGKRRTKGQKIDPSLLNYSVGS